MEFKHTLNVFVDNFSGTYKMLVYRLIVLAVTVGLGCAVVIPTLNNLLSTAQFEQLRETISSLWSDLIALNLDEVQEELAAVREAAKSFEKLIEKRSSIVALAACGLALVYFIYTFLVSVGNYVLGTLINDRMVMHANSYFTFSLFKNIKRALLYAIIYAPIVFVYDMICLVIMWAVISVGLETLPITLIKIFLVAVLFILFSAVKFTFTTDWLPALLHSKMKTGKAITHSFKVRGKRIGQVFSHSLVIKLICIAMNFAAALFTFGAGLLITLPATNIIHSSFSFVNYFTANKLKYFIDEYTIVGPKKETPVTREEFFKGDEQQ